MDLKLFAKQRCIWFHDCIKDNWLSDVCFFFFWICNKLAGRWLKPSLQNSGDAASGDTFFLLINWGKARMEWRDLQELLSPIGVSRESGCCCLLFTTALPPSAWSLVLVWCWTCQSTLCIWSTRESDTLTAAVFCVLYLSGLDTFLVFSSCFIT